MMDKVKNNKRKELDKNLAQGVDRTRATRILSLDDAL